MQRAFLYPCVIDFALRESCLGDKAPVTCNQPEPAELGFGLLALGTVACVSVPVDYASAGITLGDFFQGFAQRLLLTNVRPVFWQTPDSVVVVSVAGYASQPNGRSPLSGRPFGFCVCFTLRHQATSTFAVSPTDDSSSDIDWIDSTIHFAVA